MRLAVVAALLLPIVAEADQSYRVYTEHPRLWLEARRQWDRTVTTFCKVQ